MNLKRLKPKLLVLVLFTVAFCSGVYQTQGSSSQKPNIVFIIADDISWNDFGCYGNKVVKTPNIDKLASEGLLFNNAFLTASSCSPSRCSIISGKYPHSNGAAELHTALPESEIPFPLLLKENGYYTAHAGKWHMGEATHRAFDRYTDGNGYKNGDGGEANWVRFIKERPKDKPFFFWLASYDAHRAWGADTFKITHEPANIEVPVYFNDTPETRQDIASYYNEIARFDYHIGLVKQELQKQGVLENTVIIVMADNGRPFPRCKTRVYDSGMKTPFVVHWPAQIDKNAGHTESLISAVDIAPTILEIADVAVPENYQGVSFLQILKNPEAEVRQMVFSEHNWHDYEAHERMVRTKDFLYLFNARPNLSNCGPADSKNSPTQAALNELRDLGSLTPAQADIFVTPRPAEELFDLNQEKEQLLNVASLSRYREKLVEMRTLLKNWQNETGDTTPEDLTPDWFDRETGERLETEQIRGTMPGTEN
ncbi:sulfatase family protein [Draconibacterium sediminis]|uniref:Heparan N-sulfatase n=1 Tax=Draconibacterium sediminis TaxID=1544798 RepID=A0A0D8JDS0_9BACT|nr:sulfatase [Draconibacterium sediminis]KJF43968.1 heparan N-sulfatase [Draconibacterium sediminis]